MLNPDHGYDDIYLAGPTVFIAGATEPLVDQFRRRIAEFTYKPGIRLVVGDRMDKMRQLVQFSIETEVTDSRSGQGVIPIALRQYIDRYMLELMLEDERFLDSWVRDQVIKFELHEMDEWLLKKGEFVRNPHPGGPDGPPRTPAERGRCDATATKD